MTKPIARDPMYRKRVFDVDIIELCVRWYITYRLSYRDLVEMMAERGVVMRALGSYREHLRPPTHQQNLLVARMPDQLAAVGKFTQRNALR